MTPEQNHRWHRHPAPSEGVMVWVCFDTPDYIIGRIVQKADEHHYIIRVVRPEGPSRERYRDTMELYGPDLDEAFDEADAMLLQHGWTFCEDGSIDAWLQVATSP